MIVVTPRRVGACVFAAVIAATSLVPVAAEAGPRHWRGHNHHHGHHGRGAAAAVVGLGILGVMAGAAAANARDRDCWIERRRYVKPNGRVVLRDVEVCD